MCAHFGDESFPVEQYVRALDGVSAGQLCQVSIAALPSPAELRENFKLDELGKPQKRKPATSSAPQAAPGCGYNTCRYSGCEIPTAGRAGAPCVFHEFSRNRAEIDAITGGIAQNAELAYVWYRLAHGMHQHWARDWQIFNEQRFHQSAIAAGVVITPDEEWQAYRERVRVEVLHKIQQHQPVIDLRRDARAAI